MNDNKKSDINDKITDKSNNKEINIIKEDSALDNEKKINNYIICYDQTINEISDKKWGRYLIPYKSLLEAKRQIKIGKTNI